MVCVLSWLQEWIPKNHTFERDWTLCSNMITNLNSVVNIIGETFITILMSTKIVHFDNKQDVYMSPKDHKKSGYILDLDLLTVLY